MDAQQAAAAAASLLNQSDLTIDTAVAAAMAASAAGGGKGGKPSTPVSPPSSVTIDMSAVTFEDMDHIFLSGSPPLLVCVDGGFSSRALANIVGGAVMIFMFFFFVFVIFVA